MSPGQSTLQYISFSQFASSPGSKDWSCCSDCFCSDLQKSRSGVTSLNPMAEKEEGKYWQQYRKHRNPPALAAGHLRENGVTRTLCPLCSPGMTSQHSPAHWRLPTSESGAAFFPFLFFKVCCGSWNRKLQLFSLSLAKVTEGGCHILPASDLGSAVALRGFHSPTSPLWCLLANS